MVGGHVWRWLCRRVRRFFFAGVDRGPNGGSSLRRPGSEDPHRRQRDYISSHISLKCLTQCRLKSTRPTFTEDTWFCIRKEHILCRGQQKTVYNMISLQAGIKPPFTESEYFFRLGGIYSCSSPNEVWFPISDFLQCTGRLIPDLLEMKADFLKMN